MPGFSGLSDQGTPCQVSVVKAQRSKDAMPGFSGLSDLRMQCQVSEVKAQRSKDDAMPGFSGLGDQRTPCQVSTVKAQRSKDVMPGFRSKGSAIQGRHAQEVAIDCQVMGFAANGC